MRQQRGVAWLRDAWLMHVSAVLNALAGPCMWSTAPLVSATWYGATVVLLNQPLFNTRVLHRFWL